MAKSGWLGAAGGVFAPGPATLAGAGKVGGSPGPPDGATGPVPAPRPGV